MLHPVVLRLFDRHAGLYRSRADVIEALMVAWSLAEKNARWFGFDAANYQPEQNHPARHARIKRAADALKRAAERDAPTPRTATHRMDGCELCEGYAAEDADRYEVRGQYGPIVAYGQEVDLHVDHDRRTVTYNKLRPTDGIVQRVLAIGLRRDP